MNDYVADIASDLSVFHRVDDVDQLTITQYLERAPRLGAYSGALKARLANEAPAAGTQGVPETHGVPRAAGADGDTPPEVVAQLKRAALAARFGVDPSAIETVGAEVLVKELMS